VAGRGLVGEAPQLSRSHLPVHSDGYLHSLALEGCALANSQASGSRVCECCGHHLQALLLLLIVDNDGLDPGHACRAQAEPAIC